MTEESGQHELPSEQEASGATPPETGQQELASQQETSEVIPAAPETAGQQQPPKRRKRWPIAAAILGGVVFLFLFFIASVTLLHFTESTAFCTSCHIMYPEKTAHDFGSHANTDCGTCHVGPGVLAAVQAKLANIQYLWRYPLGIYEKPLPVPVTSMRPVEVVCYQCHNPQKFYNDTLVTVPNYAEDEANSLTETQLALRTGGGEASAGQGRGIHWHIENPVYYIAGDQQLQNIPWVQATYNGITTTYQSVDSTLTPAQIASAEKRKMDCLDCHNRATHNYTRPSDALDAAMKSGNIPADLPAVKQLGVQLLEKTYATEEEAAQAIAAAPDFWKTNYPDVYNTRKPDIDKAVAGYQTIFNTTQFPFMDVTWQAYPNNVGHKNFPGCFRCHDGKHLSQDNQAIRMECNLCHTIPQVAAPGQPLPAIPAAPSKPEPESHHSTTWLAEHRYKFDTTCAECHTVDNPGGKDNSSFCSNSACHGTQWKYAGLSAPKIRELSAPPKVPSKGVPNPIPHPISARTDCRICHGPQGVKPYPENHASFTQDMCTGCHKPTVEETPVVITPTPAPTMAAPAAATPEETPETAATPEATPTPTQAAGPPTIPHDVAGRENCLMCHDPAGNVRPAPQDHAGRTVDTCQMCHKPAQAGGTEGAQPTATPETTTAGAPAIPHEIAGREDCLVCHNPVGGMRPAPQDHAGRTKESCQVCHKPAQGGGASESQPTATPEEATE